MPRYETIQVYLCRREIVIDADNEKDAADLKGEILSESHDLSFDWYDTESVEEIPEDDPDYDFYR